MRTGLALLAVGAVLVAVAVATLTRCGGRGVSTTPPPRITESVQEDGALLGGAAGSRDAGRAEVPFEEHRDNDEELPVVLGKEEQAEEHGTAPTEELWFLVMDEAGTPLPEAAVMVSWEGGSRNGTPREEDGLIWIDHVPRGAVGVEARSPGCATFRYRTRIPWTPPRIEGIPLGPASTLTGSVRRGGEVPDGHVEVVVWKEGREGEALHVAASGESQDFRFEDAPAGEVFLTAISRQWGQGPIERISLNPGSATEVVLDLGRGAEVTGVVVDQVTGRSIPEAAVRLTVVALQVPAAIVGEATVGPDGRFRIVGASPGSSEILVTAPGYGQQRRPVQGEHPEIDLGTIALARAQTLTICLVGQSLRDPAAYVLSSADGRIEPVGLGGDGCLIVEQFGAGPFSFDLRLPDSGLISGSTHLRVGEDWRLEIPLDGLSSVLVDFDAPAGGPAAMALSVSHELVPGFEIQRSVLLDTLLLTATRFRSDLAFVAAGSVARLG